MADGTFDNLTVTGISDLASTTSVRGNLTVGDASVGLVRNLNVNGVSSLGSLSVSGATTLGDLTVGAGRPTALGGTLSVSGTTTLSSLSVGGTLSVSGATTLSGLSVGGTLSVSGATTLSGLSVGGTATLGSLNVNGATTLGDLTVGVGRPTALGGTLSVSGATTLSGLSVGGTATLSSLSVSGGATLGSLNVSGAASLSALNTSGNVGIGTNAPQARLQVAGGAIMPAAGSTESTGILFPKDPGGGAGDAAWVRYYPRTGEETTLEIGTANDVGDHIALMPSGNVGIGTNAPTTKLHVIGNVNVEGGLSTDSWISSPQWDVDQLITRQGPLPLSRTFTTGGGILIIFASGTGWSASGARQIGMNIVLDGTVRGIARSFTNEQSSHKTFATVGLVVSGIPAGSHTLELVARTGTSTDANDFFNVTVLELPFQRRLFIPPIIVAGGIEATLGASDQDS